MVAGPNLFSLKGDLLFMGFLDVLTNAGSSIGSSAVTGLEDVLTSKISTLVDGATANSGGNASTPPPAPLNIQLQPRAAALGGGSLILLAVGAYFLFGRK